MSASPSRSRARARFGVLAIALAMGLALVASTLESYLATREHAGALVAEQVQGLMRVLARELGPRGGAPTEAELQAMIEAHSERGLRYVAVLGHDGRPLAQAGESRAPPGPPPRPGQQQWLGDRVRIVAPPPGAPPMPPGPPPPPLPPDGAHGPPLLLELEPVLAQRFIADARRTLLLGVLGALLLGAAAVLLFRLWAADDRSQRELLRQRHLATLGEMSSVLAHEIRNPLAVAKGHAQLLAEKVEGDERQSRWVGEVVGSLDRLERLTSDLLELAKSGEIHPEPFSPIELARRVVAELADTRIVIQADSAPNSWPVDARHLATALTNLLRNALDASAEGQPVELRIGSDAGALVLSVRDHGAGIPAGERERIFEPFHTTRTRGAGLGLAIARRIVHLHGGQIAASNHPEGGALFEIRLPGS